MKETYKAKIISISGDMLTYEYADANGFVQISSPAPSGIDVSVGDTVWITVENGVVISTSDLVSGVYTISIKAAQGTVTKRFTVMH